MPGLPGWYDEALLPYEPHWLDLDGHRVHYLDEGDGPVLLLLHGNPVWGFLHRHLVAGLSGRFRVVVPDLPGYGLSTAREGFGFTAAAQSEVVRGFVAALGLQGITLLVQDWGGPIGLGAAVAEPERYDALIVGNTWAWPSNWWTKGFSHVMGGRLTGGLMSQRLDVFLGRMLPMMMKRRTLTDAELAMYRGPFPTPESRLPVRVLAREIRTAEPFLRDLDARLPSVTGLPSLLFWADGDIAFKAPVRAQWQARLTDRTDHLLTGCGHFWPDDAADEVIAAITAWHSAQT